MAINLKLVETFKGVDLYRITVKDTGVGIDAKSQKTIFDPFNRGNQNISKHEGSGLGLAICKQLVGLLGGTISLQSEKDKGSTFCIELKLPYFENHAKTQKKLQFKGENSLEGLKVWLVDDDETLLTMLSATLEKKGICVSAFNDPAVALSCFTENCADYLITDIQMPKMNGFELLKQTNKKNKKPIKALAVTGLNDLPENPEKLGFKAFIKKPFSPDYIIEVLQNKKAIPAQVIQQEDPKNTHPYNLSGILAFAASDEKQEQEILQTMLKNEKHNIALLERYIKNNNLPEIAKLAHKMLNIYRQLEAYELVAILIKLNIKDVKNSHRTDYIVNACRLLVGVQRLIEKISAQSKAKHLATNQS